MLTIKSLVFVLLFALPSFANSKIEVGSPAPKVSGTNEENATINFEDYYKKGKVLVYFYPKAGTPGCTKQACSLRDHYAKLQEEGVTVIGVSTDTVESQKKFKTEQKLPFTLIADTEKKITSAFDVSTFMSLASRQAFLIVDGKIAWLDRSASTDKQADDVLEVLEKLKKPATK